MPMNPKIYPKARRAIKDIWKYTQKTWGEDQANRYIHGLYEALQNAHDNKIMWRPVKHSGINGIFFIRYEHHYLFFRELSNGALGLVSVLHESMDIPRRIKDDLK